MCGIAGIFLRDQHAPVGTAELRRMTDALAHRGPDGEGFHTGAGIGLGHRRLSIVDPQGGHQPMYGRGGTVALVFNGMIYNFRALRATLEQADHAFNTNCDTETILRAWEQWGPDCVEHLSGMFAFALWDDTRRELFLARDRLGKKPLYYAVTDGGNFVFASELSALRTVPDLPLHIDPVAVDDFFAFGYVPEPRSIYGRVRRLPPAHTLLLQAGGPWREPQRYWSIPTATQPIAEQEAMEELVARLRRATAERLVADVPLGAFLSGGIDSSAVVATAAGLHGRPLDTFSIAFPGAEDETPFARQVAERYGTVQHGAAAAATDVIQAARDQALLFGEPFGDSSSVPSLDVCRLARRHATVAISGDGGDEVFAGYRRHRWHSMVSAARRFIPGRVRRTVLAELARVYPKLDRAPRWLRARHTLTELSLDSAVGYARMLTKVHDRDRRRLFPSSVAAGLDGYDPASTTVQLMETCGSDDPLVQAQFVDISTYLPGDILTKVDRTSMACSLEVRAPFLDTDLLGFGIGLPASLKLRGGVGKHVLRKAMIPYLPESLIWRGKQGFATSHATTFRAEMPRLRERLGGGRLEASGLFDTTHIARLLDQHESRQHDHSGVIWLLLVFEGFLFHHHGASRPVERAVYS